MIPLTNDDPFGHISVDGWSRLDERRATVLGYLREQTASISLSELASEVIERERNAGSTSEGNEPRAEWVQVRLHHVDLPLLEDVGFLEYDTDRRVISHLDKGGGRTSNYELTPDEQIDEVLRENRDCVEDDQED